MTPLDKLCLPGGVLLSQVDLHMHCDPEDQRNIIAFLHVMEHPGERFDGKQSVAEDVIDKELEALISGKRD